MNLFEILEDGPGIPAEVQFVRGCLYANGLGVTQSDTKALECFREASARGVVAAHYSVAGILLRTGNAADVTEAIDLLSKAADEGFVPALLRLAIFYEAGQHGSPNEAKAFEYYLRAAEHGSDAAAVSVAQRYEYPATGDESDMAVALNWYLRAAENGSALAHEILARAYRSGELGVKKDSVLAEQSERAAEGLLAEEESVQLAKVRAAAINGHRASQKILSEIYRLGALGVEKDMDKSVYWRNKYLEERPTD